MEAFGIVVCMGVVALVVSSHVAALKKEQVRINHKLDLLLRHLGVDNVYEGDIPPDLRPLLRELVAAGDKVKAVRLLRERTGFGLYDANKAIEKLSATF